MAITFLEATSLTPCDRLRHTLAATNMLLLAKALREAGHLSSASGISGLEKRNFGDDNDTFLGGSQAAMEVYTSGLMRVPGGRQWGDGGGILLSDACAVGANVALRDKVRWLPLRDKVRWLDKLPSYH